MEDTSRTVKWEPVKLFDRHADSSYVLLILNQPIICNPNLVISVWKKAQVRILVDGGANRWLKFLEITKSFHEGDTLPLPDLITGDFDSITPATEEYFKRKGVVFINTPDQDETDFTKSLREAKKLVEERKLKMDYAVALIDSSGRMDQIFANIETLCKSSEILGNLKSILLASDSLTWLLEPYQHHVINVSSVYIQARYWCGLIPLQGPTVVTTTGLKWNLSKDKLAFGELVSTSNTYSAEQVTVETDKDLIWTMQINTKTF